MTSRAQIPEQPPTLAVPPVPPRAIEPPRMSSRRSSRRRSSRRRRRCRQQAGHAAAAGRRQARAEAGAARRSGGDRADAAASGAAADGGDAERSGSGAPDPRDPRPHAEDARQGRLGVARSDDRKANFESGQGLHAAGRRGAEKGRADAGAARLPSGRRISPSCCRRVARARCSAVTPRDKIGHSEEARAFRPDCPYLAPLPKKSTICGRSGLDNNVNRGHYRPRLRANESCAQRRGHEIRGASQPSHCREKRGSKRETWIERSGRRCGLSNPVFGRAAVDPTSRVRASRENL